MLKAFGALLFGLAYIIVVAMAAVVIVALVGIAIFIVCCIYEMVKGEFENDVY